jgi:HEAT repeat protein
VLAFAHRQEKAGPHQAVPGTTSALIDVLAQFSDEHAAAAIAHQLNNPEARGKAAQALLMLGPVAVNPVLQYLDHPDPDVRQEARTLCRELNIPADRQLEQTLADLTDAWKPRARTALHHLAQLRPDGASRVKVSQALNAPLVDSDAAIRAEALDAVRVWATKDNAPTLMKLLGDLHGGQTPADRHTAEIIGEALIAIGPEVEDTVVPLLKSPGGLVRWVACGILEQIGTDKSVQPLEDAGQAYIRLDLPFYQKTQVTVAKIAARK